MDEYSDAAFSTRVFDLSNVDGTYKQSISLQEVREAMELVFNHLDACVHGLPLEAAPTPEGVSAEMPLAIYYSVMQQAGVCATSSRN